MTISPGFSANALQSFAWIASASAGRLSVSLLQRKLHIGYTAAIGLLDQMEQCGIVARNRDAQWQLTPAFRANLQTHASTGDEQAETGTQSIDIGHYTHGVLRLSGYLHEMAEEGICGHAGAVSLLKPGMNVGDIEIRDVFYQIYRDAQPSVMDAAVLMHRWFVLNAGVRCATDDVEARLAELATATNRPWCEISDREDRTDRAARRLAAYLHQVVAGKLEPRASQRGGIDARVVQYLVPKSRLMHCVPQPERGFYEYVVPCSYLVRACHALFRQGWQARDAATLIRRCLAVVEISREDKKTLEGSALAEEMPQDWCFRSGDIFARLHRAGIAFARP